MRGVVAVQVADFPTGWRPFGARVKRWRKSAIRFTAAAVFTFLALLGLDAGRRIGAPPRLTPAQQQAAARLVRDRLSGPDPGRLGVEAPSAALDELVASNPVVVSVYGQGRPGERDPVVGSWRPTETEPSLPLSEALDRAARAAVERRHARDHRVPARLTVKVDLLGPTRTVWLSTQWWLWWSLQPGRDGVLVTRGDEHAWFLPSWAVERGVAPAEAARALLDQLANGGNGPHLVRFRSTSFVQGPDPTAPALEVYRGNVLLGQPTEASVRQAVVEAADYLAGSVRADGRYCYVYLPIQDRCGHDYNLLRHAGTTYSLYQVHREAPNERRLRAAERAMDWLRAQVRLAEGRGAFLLEGDKAKLGGAALALIALVEREKALGDGRDRPLMRQLAQFLMSQQREDGYFHSYFAWKPGVRLPEHKSIYYPGEALLALIRLHQIQPEASLLEAAVRGAHYLVHDRWTWAGAELYVPPDAWLAQALVELDVVVSDDAFRDYAYAIVETTEMVTLRREEGAPPDFVGGVGNGLADPRVTPTGARNEAATAAWRMARSRGEHTRAAALRRLCLDAAGFQLNQQYRPENSYFLPAPQRARGGFRGSPLQAAVQIDYVQHNVSALLGVLTIYREGNS